MEAFATIRAISAFRLPATRRDYLVVTSDSGSITVLSPDVATATFRQVHCEPFGRSGCRRVIPGQFLACEPRGRACMISAIERCKFAYVLNRDPQDNLTISSPLESHKSSCTTYALQPLDVGFENPVFAALERSYDDNAVKHLVCYELDLGLNHVVRKLASPVRPSSFVMLPVPGHTDGPGGILICSAGFVTYRNLLVEESGVSPPDTDMKDVDQPDAVHYLEAPLPFREGTDQENTMIVCGTVYHDRKRNAFFFMLCTEFGDLIKAELTWAPETGVSDLRLVYFDSLPSPAAAMTIFRSGFLLVVLEGADNLLMKFKSVDVPDDDPAGGLSLSSVHNYGTKKEPSSMDIDSISKATHASNENDMANGSLPQNVTASPVPQEHSRFSGKLRFTRKPRLTYLKLSSTMESLAPILGMCNATDVDGEPSVMLSTGKGKCASVRGLRRGIGVVDLLSPHTLSSRVYNLFTLKSRSDSLFYRYIVVSFRERTKFFLVGDAQLDETLTSGFHLSSSTICAGQMSADSLVQIYAEGVRYIPGGRVDEAKEWSPPVPSRIVAGCCNNGQVVVALSSGYVVYFEVDSQKDGLIEVKRIEGALVPSGGNESVSHGAGDDGATPAIAIPEVPSGRRRASFFAVGDGANCKVRIYRVGHDGNPEPLGIHVAPASIESLAFVDYGIKSKFSHADGSAESGNTSIMDEPVPYEPLLSVVIGTKRGAVVRIAVDGVTGSLGDKRSMFVGPDKVRVRCVTMGGVPTCFALGSKPYMMFAQGGRIVVSPLGTENMQYAACFFTEQWPDGFVAAHGSKLRLFCIDQLHTLQAGADMPMPSPASALPAGVAMGCLFQLSRTRFSGTVRRVIRVAEPEKSSAGSESSRRESGKRARSQSLFVVVESDHRAAGNVSSNNHDGSINKSKTVDVGPAGVGSWFSRLHLARLGPSDDVGENEAENENASLDGSETLSNFSLESVTLLDRLEMDEPSDCVVGATSTCSFVPSEGESDTLSYVVMSHAKNLVISATSPTSGSERHKMDTEGNKVFGSLVVYRIDREYKLRWMHETRIEEPAHSIVSFRDMVAVGVGTTVRLYGLGKRQLLRKVEYRLAVQNRVCAMAVAGGDRIFVADKQESVTLFKYVRPGSVNINGLNGGGVARMDEGLECGRLVAIASDELARWVTCLYSLDHSTVCGGDMFGNIFVLRLPPEVEAGAEEIGGPGAASSSARGARMTAAQCAAHRLRVEACMHVGSAVTCMTGTRLNGAYVGGQYGGVGSGSGGGVSTMAMANGTRGELSDCCVIYGTVGGSIGVICPFATTGDADFGHRLEMAVRKGWRSVVGRDHLSYRSSFYSSRGIVDGDLCELFVAADKQKREEWAKAVGRPVQDVVRKLDELRMSAL